VQVAARGPLELTAVTRHIQVERSSPSLMELEAHWPTYETQSLKVSEVHLKAWGLANLGMGAELSKAVAKELKVLPRQPQQEHQEHVAKYFQLKSMADRGVVQVHQEATLVPGVVGTQRVAAEQSPVAQDMRVPVVDPWIPNNSWVGELVTLVVEADSIALLLLAMTKCFQENLVMIRTRNRSWVGLLGSSKMVIHCRWC
jgi:hypothetical protein